MATYFTKEFKKLNYTLLRINLDDWILPKEDRESFNVFDSFQFPKLIGDLAKIMEGETIELPGYAVHPSWDATRVSYRYSGEQIILVEGVVALADEELRNRSSLRIFKQIEPKKLKERFTRFYQWKGLTGNEIESLYNKRKTNEYDIIEKHGHFAVISRYLS